ncbi:MAG: molybdenum cofactor biosynthesis protein MoaE [Janthinobacterium lividum]
MISIRVQTEDFDLNAELAALRAGDAAIGAVVSFVGIVRDLNQGSAVHELELEHYPGMTERALTEIVETAMRRWPLSGARVVHRIGRLAPTAQIVLVAVACAHRGDAFAACEYIIDHLKTVAPFWKKENTPDGARWLEARATDQAALDKWREPPPIA